MNKVDYYYYYYCANSANLTFNMMSYWWR